MPTDPIAPARREEIRQRCEAAQAGPWMAIFWPAPENYYWVAGPPEHDISSKPGPHVASRVSEADAAFIAHARTDIPDLLAALDRLEGEHREVCICAAVKFPDGRVARGHRHDGCYQTAEQWKPKPDLFGGIQGFVTSRNRFVPREEGASLQNAAGIVSAQKGTSIGRLLFSEDLYLGTNDPCADAHAAPAAPGGEDR